MDDEKPLILKEERIHHFTSDFSDIQDLTLMQK